MRPQKSIQKMKIRRKRSYSNLKKLASFSVQSRARDAQQLQSATDSLGNLLLRDLCGNVGDIVLPLVMQEQSAGSGLRQDNSAECQLCTTKKSRDDDTYYVYPTVSKDIQSFVQALPPAPLVEVSVIPPQKIASSDTRLTLVLDIDETLVHCSLDQPLHNFSFRTSVRMADGTQKDIYVRKRPHLDTFLQEASKHFELIAFTAGLSRYANAVLDVLDPTKTLFRHRLFRDVCYIKDGKFVKNLNILGRDLSRTVIVDNAAESFGFQPSNGILINSWYEDPDDVELLKVLRVLKDLIDEDISDVREFLSKRFRFETVLGIQNNTRAI